MLTTDTKTDRFLAELTPYVTTNLHGPFPAHLICHPPGLTEDQRAERRNTARHEAAHFVASRACHGSTVHRVFVHPTGNTKKGYVGRVQSAEVYVEETLFVILAGVEWEALHPEGDPIRSNGDAHDAEHIQHPDKKAIARATRAFLIENHRLVESVALAFMALCRKDGHMGDNRLRKVAKWARGALLETQGYEPRGLNLCSSPPLSRQAC